MPINRAWAQQTPRRRVARSICRLTRVEGLESVEPTKMRSWSWNLNLRPGRPYWLARPRSPRQRPSRSSLMRLSPYLLPSWSLPGLPPFVFASILSSMASSFFMLDMPPFVSMGSSFLRASGLVVPGAQREGGKACCIRGLDGGRR